MKSIKQAMLDMLATIGDEMALSPESKTWLRGFIEDQTEEALRVMFNDQTLRNGAVLGHILTKRMEEFGATTGSDRIMTLPSGRKVVLKNIDHDTLAELHEIKMEGVNAIRQRASLDAFGIGGGMMVCEPGIRAARPFVGRTIIPGASFGREAYMMLAGIDVGPTGDISNPRLSLEEQQRKLAVAKRHRQIHNNSGFSNSWLRRLNEELEKFGKDLTNRKLVKFIMDNCNLYPTWDDVVEGIRFYITADESSKKALQQYRKKAKKLGKKIKQ